MKKRHGQVPMKMSQWLRLHLILSMAAAFLWLSGTQAAAFGAESRHINAQRLQGTLEKMSEFGRNPEGGVTRLGFSQTEIDARTYVIGLMKDAGLEVRVDAAGNIFG